MRRRKGSYIATVSVWGRAWFCFWISPNAARFITCLPFAPMMALSCKGRTKDITWKIEKRKKQKSNGHRSNSEKKKFHKSEPFAPLHTSSSCIILAFVAIIIRFCIVWWKCMWLLIAKARKLVYRCIRCSCTKWSNVTNFFSYTRMYTLNAISASIRTNIARLDRSYLSWFNNAHQVWKLCAEYVWTIVCNWVMLKNLSLP